MKLLKFINGRNKNKKLARVHPAFSFCLRTFCKYDRSFVKDYLKHPSIAEESVKNNLSIAELEREHKAWKRRTQKIDLKLEELAKNKKVTYKEIKNFFSKPLKPELGLPKDKNEFDIKQKEQILEIKKKAEEAGFPKISEKDDEEDKYDRVEYEENPTDRLVYSEFAAKIKENPDLFRTTIFENDGMESSRKGEVESEGDEEMGEEKEYLEEEDPTEGNFFDRKELPVTYQQATFVAMMRAGCHYGGRVEYTNPWMFQYILCEREGQHIFDISRSLAALRKSMIFLQEIVLNKGRIWFVCNSPEIRETIEKLAHECGEASYIVKAREGLIANFNKNLADARRNKTLPVKENDKTTLIEKIRSVAPFRQIDCLPSAIVIFNLKGNRCIVDEAFAAKIPVIALCDSDSNIQNVTYVIPGNDDTVESIGFFAKMLTMSVSEMKEQLEYKEKMKFYQKDEDLEIVKISEKVKKRIPSRGSKLQIEMLNPKMRAEQERLRKETKTKENKSALEDDVFVKSGL